MRHVTLQEFRKRPDREDDQREELIEGEVILSPGARADHSEIVDLLREQLIGLKQHGYVLRNDFSCILGDHSMPVPDLAAVQRARWDKAVNAKAWLIGSPELVIEISSPSNRKLHRKAALYLEHGAEQVWIVYPKANSVAVFTADQMKQARLGEVLDFHDVKVAVASIFRMD